MSDKYIPQVGDRVRRGEWLPHIAPVEVLGYSEGFLWVKDGNNRYTEHAADWIKVEPKVPLPERWVTIHIEPDSYVQHLTKRDAYLFDRIAVIHIYTDAEGVDHADIERVGP